MSVIAPVVVGNTRAFGELLRAWRTTRGQTQLSLSLSTGVSARHLSYLETGRASPSRDMVLELGQALELPLRDRNAMLQAAGYAAMFRETPLDASTLGPVREAICVMLASSEPYPTFVVNRRYDILDANPTGRWLLAAFCADLARFSAPHNTARLLVSPLGMRPYVENWAEVTRKVLARLVREVGGAHARDRVDDALLAEVEPTLAELGPAPSPTEALPILLGVQFRRGDLSLRTFTTIATLGTPLVVTLQELRIETLYPADPASRAILVARGGERGAAIPG
jgi:transcriptional regulator with XRE-family HTH domain